MSSLVVRTAIKEFLAENSQESVIDLTSHYEEIKELLDLEDLQPNAPWLGIQFSGDQELPVSLAATNDQGLYREFGVIFLHICAEARIGVGDSILIRGRDLIKLFRGRRIGAIVIESVSPVNTSPGTTLEFEGGYMSGTISISYHYDSTPD